MECFNVHVVKREIIKNTLEKSDKYLYIIASINLKTCNET